MTLVSIYETALAGRKHGILLYGPDLSSWPCWAVDMLEALDAEAELIEAHRVSAK